MTFLIKKKIIRLNFFLCFLFVLKFGYTQQVKFTNCGLTAGCVISAGTHISQFGFFVRTYYLSNHFQWNNDFRINYYFKYLGPKKPHPELQLSSGILFGYGKKEDKMNLFIGKTGNQTFYQNSIAYAYNAYFNYVRTSQQTGTIAFQINQFFVNTENDLFARPLKDRFRTAAIQCGFQKDNLRFVLTHTMWTGKLGNQVRDSLYKSPAGYLDTTNSVYAKFSNGLLYFGAEMFEKELQQQLKVNVGIDAEQIRHAVQNRFIHDACLLPKKMRNTNNFHFPMIDTNEQQYLFRPNQKIRTPKLYYNLFTNADLIY